MKFDWKITTKGKYVDSGTIEAATQKQALGEVLLAQVGKRDPDTSYSVKVGDSMTTSFGDEFERSAGATSWGSDEPELDKGYLFQPKPSDLGLTPIHDKIREIVEYAGWDPDGHSVDRDTLKKMADDFSGCDKTFETCRDKYQNVGNFTGTNRGAPCGHTFKDKGCGWDGADATPLEGINKASDGVKKVCLGGEKVYDSRDFLAPKLFPREAYASSALQAAFGDKAPKVARIIEGYGHRPEDVVDVYRDDRLRCLTCRGRVYDRDRNEMAWQVQISEVELHHM